MLLYEKHIYTEITSFFGMKETVHKMIILYNLIPPLENSVLYPRKQKKDVLSKEQASKAEKLRNGRMKNFRGLRRRNEDRRIGYNKFCTLWQSSVHAITCQLLVFYLPSSGNGTYSHSMQNIWLSPPSQPSLQHLGLHYKDLDAGMACALFLKFLEVNS